MGWINVDKKGFVYPENGDNADGLCLIKATYEEDRMSTEVSKESGVQMELDLMMGEGEPVGPKYPMIDNPLWKVNEKVCDRLGLDLLIRPTLDTYDGSSDGAKRGVGFDFSALTKKPRRRLSIYPIPPAEPPGLAPNLDRLGEEGVLMCRDLVDEALNILQHSDALGSIVQQMPLRAKIAGSWHVIRRVSARVFRKAAKARAILTEAYQNLCNGNVADCTMQMQVVRTLFA